MEKAFKTVSAIAGRVLFIGFSIQIILGICWMVGNYAGFQKFGESILYEEISKTLICDEYEGILYPVLIMTIRGIGELVLIPYRYILYLLQIGFAFFAAYKLLQSVGIRGKFWQIWGSLAMLTFPMAMQCHLAILPDSLVCSMLLLEIAFAVEILLEGQQLNTRAFAKTLALWMIAALTRPEYLYVGAVPVLFLFLYGFVKAWKREKKRILYNGILVMAFLGITLSVNDLTQVEGYYGRVHQSLNASMLSRCAWLFAREDYDYWPEEVKAYVSYGQSREIDYYADNMERILGRAVEAAVGPERAEELFGEIAVIAWQNHRGDILHRTAWDIVGYTVSPMVLQSQFVGKAYDAYSGRNYDIMRERAPLLTKYYMDYGCWWFAAGLVIGVFCQIMCVINYLVGIWKRKTLFTMNKGKVLAVMTCLFTSGLLVLLYSLRGAGMMDYKKSIAVTLLWILGMIFYGRWEQICWRCKS